MEYKFGSLSPAEMGLIKQELEIIDRTIARIDQINYNMKNWTVLIWGGLYLITEHIGKNPGLISLTALIPISLIGILN